MLDALMLMLALQLEACAGTISGRVVDAGSGRGRSGVTVEGNGRLATTTANGAFVLQLPCGPVTLVARTRGEALGTADALVTDGPSTLDIEVVAAPLRESVEVTGRAEDALPAREVSPLAVASTAGAAENVFRVLQLLPGVAGTDEFSGRLSVRGGGPDQNLTIMDGVEVHNPYRLLGLVSAFNPETVQSFSLSTGAFPARYGDRLSSLLVVENRTGTEERAVSGSANLSLTDGNVLAEGRLPGGARGSWLVTGRRTYYDIVAERFVGDDLPGFNDLQGRVAWRPRDAQRLSAFFLRSREDADAAFDGEIDGEEGAFVVTGENEVASLSFDTTAGARGLSRTVLAYVTNSELLDVDARFGDTSRRSNAPGDDYTATLVNVVFDRTVAVRDLALRQDLTWVHSPRLTLDAGGELHRLRTSVHFRIDGERNPTAANGSSVAGGTGLPSRLDSQRDGTRWGAYAQARLAHGRLTLEPGVRLDGGSVGGVTPAPRLAATYALSGRLRLRGAAGLHTQSPGYEKLVAADYFFDLTPEIARGLKRERATHVVGSVERDLRPGLVARVELYHKRFADLVVGRAETAEELAQRRAQYDFPQSLRDSLPREPTITSVPINGGSGTASGLEVYLSRSARSSRDRLTGWLSYTLGRARRDVYGYRYPFEYDRRHALSVVGSWRFSPKLELALTGRAASGFPRTPVQRLRVAAVADALDADADGNRAELVPERDVLGLPVWTTDRGGIADLSSARLPAFARLDLRLTFKPRGTPGRWTFYIDVINATNRKNAGVVEESLVHAPGADRPRLLEEPDGSIPFLPSFGIRFSF